MFRPTADVTFNSWTVVHELQHARWSTGASSWDPMPEYDAELARRISVMTRWLRDETRRAREHALHDFGLPEWPSATGVLGDEIPVEEFATRAVMRTIQSITRYGQITARPNRVFLCVDNSKLRRRVRRWFDSYAYVRPSLWKADDRWLDTATERISRYERTVRLRAKRHRDKLRAKARVLASRSGPQIPIIDTPIEPMAPCALTSA